MSDQYLIRPLTLEEVRLTSDLGNSIYPLSLNESFESSLSKYLFYPLGSLGLVIDGEIVGYAIGFPWKGDKIVLANFCGPYPEDPDRLYIHDVAIKQEFRRNGHGRDLFKAMIDVGKTAGFRKFSLVAVSNISGRIAASLGFEYRETILYSHGSGAIVMDLDLDKL